MSQPSEPFIQRLARGLLPRGLRKTLSRGLRRATRWPPVGAVDLGHLGSTKPLSRDWGFDRGTPIDRHYIEGFLEAHRSDVRGRVLEVLNDNYTVRFGGDRVTHSDVLHHVPGNPKATVVADLTVPESIPEGAHESFDCVICTQTLQFIYDVRTAAHTLHRILKPGGTLLVTVPGITHISRADMERSGDYWRFTRASVQRILAEAFGQHAVEITTFGNVAAAAAFLHGVASQELDPDQLQTYDPDYEVILGARAVKAGGGP